jgi:hypothetical protein
MFSRQHDGEFPQIIPQRKKRVAQANLKRSKLAKLGSTQALSAISIQDMPVALFCLKRSTQLGPLTLTISVQADTAAAMSERCLQRFLLLDLPSLPH